MEEFVIEIAKLVCFMIIALIAYYLLKQIVGKDDEVVYIRTRKKEGYSKEWNLYGLKRGFIFASINGVLKHMTKLGYFVKIKRVDLLDMVLENQENLQK